jgi:hypothetical protein
MHEADTSELTLEWSPPELIFEQGIPALVDHLTRVDAASRPPRMSTMSPWQFGVKPGSEDPEALNEYVPRDIDARLREALEEGLVVALQAPRGAGHSDFSGRLSGDPSSGRHVQRGRWHRTRPAASALHNFRAPARSLSDAE